MTKKRIWGLWISPGISKHSDHAESLEFRFLFGEWKPNRQGRFFITHPKFSSAMEGFNNRNFEGSCVGWVMASVENQKKLVTVEDFVANRFRQRGLHFIEANLDIAARNKIRTWLQRKYPDYHVRNSLSQERDLSYREYLRRKGSLQGSTGLERPDMKSRRIMNGGRAKRPGK